MQIIDIWVIIIHLVHSPSFKCHSFGTGFDEWNVVQIKILLGYNFMHFLRKCQSQALHNSSIKSPKKWTLQNLVLHRMLCKKNAENKTVPTTERTCPNPWDQKCPNLPANFHRLWIKIALLHLTCTVNLNGYKAIRPASSDCNFSPRLPFFKSFSITQTKLGETWTN